MAGFERRGRFITFLTLSFFLSRFLRCSSIHDYEDVKLGNVSCNESGITVDISLKSSFQGIIFSQGNYHNSNCSYYTPSTDVTHNVSLYLSLVDCGTLIREQHGTLYTSNIVVIQKYRFVETTFDTSHDLLCKLPYTESLKTKETWINLNLISYFKNDVLESWMNFQTGSDILGKTVSNKLIVGDEFLIAIYLKDGGINKGLQVQSCSAYDGETINESQYVLTMYDRRTCESSPWVSGFNLTTERKDLSDSMTYAVIKAFKFPMTKNVHITCSVQVCSKRCWDYCKEPEYQRSNSYPRIMKRSTSEGLSDKSLPGRYQLMKATVKALGAKLIETNKAHKSKTQNLGFRKRITNSSNYEDVIAPEEYDYRAKENTVVSESSQSSNSTDSLNNDNSESELYANNVYVFNLTNDIVVLQGKEYNSSSEPSANCVSNLTFIMVMVPLGLISFLLLMSCIGVSLHFRKERKQHKTNSLLLYNFY